MVNPLVSIISPTYNHERFIGHCIESVLAQTYDNWEMTVVDDGSTDGTWQLVTEYAARDSRIRPFRQENRGIWRLAETYNFVLEQSTGALLAVLEGDDVWPLDKLAVQVPIHLALGRPLSFGTMQYVDVDGIPSSPTHHPQVDRLTFLHEPNPQDLVVRLIRGEYFVPAVTVMVSRDPLVKIGGFQQPNYLPLVDYPTWIQLGSAHGGFCFIDHLLGYYRQLNSQATWVHARAIARGEYRLVQELCASGRLGPDVSTRLLATDARPRLLSANRRGFLTDGSYRAAVLAWDRGERRQAVGYCLEIARFGRVRWFSRCCAMMGWKQLRTFKNNAGRIVKRATWAKRVAIDTDLEKGF